MNIETLTNISALTGEANSLLDAVFEHPDEERADTVDFMVGIDQKRRSSNALLTMVQKLDHHSSSSLGLYGREGEVQVIQRVFDDSCRSSGSRQVLIVKGEAGSGKTALIQAALKPKVAATKGFYLFGKYEQRRLHDNDAGCEWSSLSASDSDDESPSSANGMEYAAIVQACQRIGQEILRYRFEQEKATEGEDNGNETFQAHNEDSNAWSFSFFDLRTRLIQELGSEGIATLSHLIPSLPLIVQMGDLKEGICSGNPSDVSDSLAEAEEEEMDYKERTYQFGWAVRCFLRVLASFGPVSLVLDDLQWAEKSSLDLIHALVCDNTIPAQMLVGIYRNKGVTRADHPIAIFTQRLQETTEKLNHGRTNKVDDSIELCKHNLTQLDIGNLSKGDIHQMLLDLLCPSVNEPRGASKILALAECMSRKTRGNAFFVVTFLRTILKLRLLTFDEEQDMWKWDIVAINEMANPSENAVDFVVRNLRQLLPCSVRMLLPLVSSFGHVIHVSMVELLIGHLNAESQARSSAKGVLNTPTPDIFLKYCQAQGLIYQRSDQSYAFEHDRIQEAALHLIKPSDLQHMRLQLGRELLEKLDETSLDQHLFVVADLFGRDGKAALHEFPQEQHLKLARLYLRAGQKCITTAAFVQAAVYLARGMKMLPPRHWQDNYELSLDLYSTSAEVLCVGGKHDKMKVCCNEILAQKDRPLLDKRRAYTAMVYAMKASVEISEAKVLTLDLMDKLGATLPKRGLVFHIVGNLIRNKVSIKSSLEKMTRAGTMTDPKKLWTMRLLDDLVTLCYQSDRAMLPLVIFKGYRETLNHGVSKYAPVFFAMMGFLSVSLGDFDAGKQYGQTALQMLDRIDKNEMKARPILLVNHFILPWQMPMEWCAKEFMRGHMVGVASGDTEDAAMAMYAYILAMFETGGKPLDELSVDCAKAAAFAAEAGQRKIELQLRIMWQQILNLSRPAASGYSASRLHGEALDLEAVEAEIQDKKDEHTALILQRANIATAFWNGDYGHLLYLARNAAFDKDAYGKRQKSSPTVMAVAMYMALSSLIQAQVTRGVESRQLRSLGGTFRSKIEKWKAKGNPNVLHLSALLEAEAAILSNDCAMARKNFEVALTLCKSRGFVNYQALTHERFSRFLLSQADVAGAQEHATESLELYCAWGAGNRQQILESKYNLQFDTATGGAGTKSTVESSNSTPIVDMSGLTQSINSNSHN